MVKRTTITFEDEVYKGLLNYMAHQYLSAAKHVSLSRVVNIILKNILTEKGHMGRTEDEEVR